jgi:4-hydroxybenzoate polyprenyltransferase
VPAEFSIAIVSRAAHAALRFQLLARYLDTRMRCRIGSSCRWLFVLHLTTIRGRRESDTKAKRMAIIKQYRIIEILLFSTTALFFLKYGAPVQQFLLFLSAIVLYNYFMFSFNDFMDKDKDSHDAEKKTRNPFLNSQSRQIATLLMALSGALLILLGLFKIHKIYVNVLLFLIAFSYSAGIRAKNKPFLDVIVHWAWVAGTLVLGFLFFDVPVTIREATLVFQYLIVSTLIELSQGIRDYEVDKNTDENTTVVYIGLSKTKTVYALFIFLFALATPLLVDTVYLKYLSLLFLPIYYFSRQDTYDQRANVINLMIGLSVFTFIL